MEAALLGDSGCVSPSVVSDSLRPHGLQPTRLLCPWGFPGKNTGVDCHFPSSGDLPDQGIEPECPALQADSLLSEPLLAEGPSIDAVRVLVGVAAMEVPGAGGPTSRMARAGGKLVLS